MARSEKNVTVTRRVSETEQRDKSSMDTGPRLRVGLLCVDAEGSFFFRATHNGRQESISSAVDRHKAGDRIR